MSNEREYKSTVFSMLLQEPKYALDVYNAIRICAKTGERNYETF